MRVEFTRRFVSPPIITAAKAMVERHRLRYEGRAPTDHVDTVLDDPHAVPHRLLSVPRGTYFRKTDLGAGKTELVVCKRDGTPVGKAVRCRETRLETVIRDRRIFPVVVSDTPAIYHLPPQQWLVLRRAVQIVFTKNDTDRPRRRPKSDPLRDLHGKKFHGLGALRTAFKQQNTPSTT